MRPSAIARSTRSSWQGRVIVGHLTELAALPDFEQTEIAADIAAAGIGVVCLPATDLYLMGRRDSTNVRRGLTPIRRLLAAGVTVALATNNVRNPFTPVGTADLAHMTFLAAVGAHMGTPEDIRQLVAAITTAPARMLRLPDVPTTPAELGVGHRADLVVWDCQDLDEIVVRLAPRHLVLKHGRVSVECERSHRERWRDTRDKLSR